MSYGTVQPALADLFNFAASKHMAAPTGSVAHRRRMGDRGVQGATTPCLNKVVAKIGA